MKDDVVQRGMLVVCFKILKQLEDFAAAESRSVLQSHDCQEDCLPVLVDA